MIGFCGIFDCGIDVLSSNLVYIEILSVCQIILSTAYMLWFFFSPLTELFSNIDSDCDSVRLQLATQVETSVAQCIETVLS